MPPAVVHMCAALPLPGLVRYRFQWPARVRRIPRRAVFKMTRQTLLDSVAANVLRRMGSLRRFRGPSGSPSSQNSATTFDVVAGFHQGVRLPLNRAEYRIGSTAGSDIVLRDPGVAPVHAVL